MYRDDYLNSWNYNSMSLGQLKQIWNIMCLRAGPQSLPYSYSLLVLFFFIHLTIDIALSGREALHWSGLLSSVINLVFTVAFVYVLLQWSKKIGRFVQTLLALLGVEIFIGLIGAVLLLSSKIPGLAALLSLLWLGLIIWNVIIAGHIFRHALDTSMLWGVVLSILYNVLAYNVVVAIAALG